jgi:hypothetical protein
MAASASARVDAPEVIRRVIKRHMPLPWELPLLQHLADGLGEIMDRRGRNAKARLLHLRSGLERRQLIAAPLAAVFVPGGQGRGAPDPAMRGFLRDVVS